VLAVLLTAPCKLNYSILNPELKDKVHAYIAKHAGFLATDPHTHMSKPIIE
jgi:hypothetical protein